MLQEEVEGGVEDQGTTTFGAQMGSPTPRPRGGVITLTNLVLAHFLLMVAFSYCEYSQLAPRNPRSMSPA